MPQKKSRVTRAAPFHEQVYQIIRLAIMNQDYRAGQALSESELSQSLGVSRTPVREALRRLAQEGLVVGTSRLVVYAPTVADIADSYIGRAALEGMAATVFASEPARGPRIRRLREILQKAAVALDDNNVDFLIKYNTEFHDTLVESAQSQRLIQLVDSFKFYILNARHHSLKLPGEHRDSWLEHQKILDIIESGDAELAGTTVRQHILRSGYRVIQRLGSMKESNPSYRILLAAHEQAGGLQK